MKATTKIFIALATTAAICLAIIGVAYGYYVTTQTRVYANTPNTADGGFWGWFGGCLGFAPRQPYAYQYQYPSNNISTAESKPRLLSIQVRTRLLGLVNYPFLFLY
jgi:hypothetical protein